MIIFDINEMWNLIIKFFFEKIKLQEKYRLNYKLKIDSSIHYIDIATYWTWVGVRIWGNEPFDIAELWANNLKLLYTKFRAMLSSVWESARLSDFIERIEVTIEDRKYIVVNSKDISSLPGTLVDKNKSIIELVDEALERKNKKLKNFLIYPKNGVIMVLISATGRGFHCCYRSWELDEALFIKEGSGLNIIVKDFEWYIENYEKETDDEDEENEEDDYEDEEYYVVIEHLPKLDLNKYFDRILSYIDMRVYR